MVNLLHNLSKRVLEEQRDETSTIRENQFPWKKFWAAKRVAPKIKTFIWRAIYNGIGVAEKVGRFVDGVLKDCNFCSSAIESVEHMLIHCNFAKAVWFASPQGLRLQENHQLNLQRMIELWIRNNDNEYCPAMGMAICRGTRNTKVFENKNISIQGTLAIAIYWFNMYYNFSDEGETEAEEGNNPESLPSVSATWEPPPDPFIKVNVDAAWKDGSYACVAVARDNNSVCCGAGTRTGTTDSVVYAEADGFLLVAELSKWLNFDVVIIEGDSQVVVNNLTGAARSIPWRIWKLKDDTLKLMASFNNNSFIKFVPKKDNTTTHSLAAYAFTHKVQARWTRFNIPSDVVTFSYVTT
ncbi:uncharacterized protein LOC113353572 [Papaver somniferum]|uniref:uncharacterized protein LOC113353572 n=1 Tax=Papaver somniferum TaxID=3469 RepID=UPI000E6FCACF|nr:uncharacterized protein LOC113353572 [Papaver somniferum]